MTSHLHLGRRFSSTTLTSWTTTRIVRSRPYSASCRLDSIKRCKVPASSPVLGDRSMRMKRNDVCGIQSSVRSFSSSTPEHSKKEFAQLTRLEDANPERIHGIQVNPDSLGYSVLPGNLTYKTYKWSGNTRKIPMELAHGYFWMISDLKKTNSKPTLSNEKLIPEGDAQIFPILENLTTLDDLETQIDLPLFFLEQAHPKKKKKHKGGGKITLVTVTYRDSGVKMVPTWTDPFEEAFGTDPSGKTQTFNVSITESWPMYQIRNTVKRVMKKNTPAEKHASTLAYFGTKEVMEFRDILRMHNIMTTYVFLLDDLGRVRFAGSGEASNDEAKKLIRFANDLLREIDGARQKSSKKRL